MHIQECRPGSNDCIYTSLRQIVFSLQRQCEHGIEVTLVNCLGRLNFISKVWHIIAIVFSLHDHVVILHGRICSWVFPT